MPTLSADEKSKVKSCIHSSGSKALHAARAKVYHARPDPTCWSYAGIQGALAFAKNGATGALAFKMVDLEGTRGVIWEHEIYQGFEYNPDWALFHPFAGDDCMIRFDFVDEQEAKSFWKKVTAKKDQKSRGKIDKSIISAPTAGSFVHLGHMGYDADKGFISAGVDPSWAALLTSLEGSGISKEVLAKDMEFIKDFVRKYQEEAPKKEPKKPKSPPPAPRRTHVTNGSESSQTQVSVPRVPRSKSPVVGAFSAPPPPRRPAPPTSSAPSPVRPVAPPVSRPTTSPCMSDIFFSAPSTPHPTTSNLIRTSTTTTTTTITTTSTTIITTTSYN